jgi:hypothetical protein
MGYGNGASGGSYPPHDLRGQGGNSPDGGFRLPNEGLSQAKYANDVEHEADDAAHGRQPPLMERVKRWFSARF